MNSLIRLLITAQLEDFKTAKLDLIFVTLPMTARQAGQPQETSTQLVGQMVMQP